MRRALSTRRAHARYVALQGLVIALGGCTCEGSRETGGEGHPYVRCASGEPAASRELRTAAASVVVAGRDVTIEPTGSARIALVVGPASSGEPFEPALDSIEAGAPSALLVIGSIGDDEASARAALEALASLDLPTLLILGGRDRPHVVSEALASVEEPGRSRIIELSGVRRVHIGALVLVPVPGAPEGRYAIGDDACGLGQVDVDEIARDLGEADGEHRVLVSYAAPASGTAATAGISGAEAGSPLVRALATAIGASGWLAAFGASGSALPDLAASYDVAIGAPPAVGVLEREDGTRTSPGPIFLDVGPEGLSVVRVGEVAAP